MNPWKIFSKRKFINNMGEIYFYSSERSSMKEKKGKYSHDQDVQHHVDDIHVL
jgi:hypothetical protein